MVRISGVCRIAPQTSELQASNFKSPGSYGLSQKRYTSSDGLQLRTHQLKQSPILTCLQSLPQFLSLHKLTRSAGRSWEECFSTRFSQSPKNCSALQSQQSLETADLSVVKPSDSIVAPADLRGALGPLSAVKFMISLWVEELTYIKREAPGHGAAARCAATAG